MKKSLKLRILFSRGIIFQFLLFIWILNTLCEDCHGSIKVYNVKKMIQIWPYWSTDLCACDMVLMSIHVKNQLINIAKSGSSI